jgi:hypothetical protein
VQLVSPLVATDPAMWPEVSHSCTDSSGGLADPGVRLSALATAFGDQGRYFPLCAPSLAPALQTIAAGIGDALGPMCIAGVVADADPATPGVQPDCEVADLAPDAHGGHTQIPIPSCAASGGARPCWAFDDSGSTTACPGQHLLAVTRATAPPPDVLTRASCTVCAPGATDPRCN